MPNMSEFLQTYMGMANMVQRMEAQKTQQGLLSQAYARDAIQDYQAIAAQTVDPNQRAALARRFERMTGMTAHELLDLAPPPETGVINRYLERESLLPEEERSPLLADRGGELEQRATAATTGGMNTAQLAGTDFLTSLYQGAQPLPGQQEQAVAGLTGTTPTDLLMQGAIGMLPQNEMIQGAGIGLGTRMNAGQDASNQLGWANHRLGWATLMSRMEEADRERLGQDPDAINFGPEARGLIQEIGTTMRTLQAEKGNMSPQELEATRIYLNGLGQAAEQFGFGFKKIESIDEILLPGKVFGYPGAGR